MVHSQTEMASLWNLPPQTEIFSLQSGHVASLDNGLLGQHSLCLR